jgi:hypothetical protein
MRVTCSGQKICYDTQLHIQNNMADDTFSKNFILIGDYVAVKTANNIMKSTMYYYETYAWITNLLRQDNSLTVFTFPVSCLITESSSIF